MHALRDDACLTDRNAMVCTGLLYTKCPSEECESIAPPPADALGLSGVGSVRRMKVESVVPAMSTSVPLVIENGDNAGSANPLDKTEKATLLCCGCMVATCSACDAPVVDYVGVGHMDTVLASRDPNNSHKCKVPAPPTLDPSDLDPVYESRAVLCCYDPAVALTLDFREVVSLDGGPTESRDFESGDPAPADSLLLRARCEPEVRVVEVRVESLYPPVLLLTDEAVPRMVDSDDETALKSCVSPVCCVRKGVRRHEAPVPPRRGPGPSRPVGPLRRGRGGPPARRR